MAATMATMAILNAKCLATSTPKLANPTKPVASPSSSKPAALLSIQSLPKGLTSSAVAGAIFAALSASEPAMAAQQLAEIAADSSRDSRGLALLLPIVPAVAWVLFNILQPALNQLNRMRESKGVVAAGLGGLGALAALAHAHEASAAEATAASGDSRGQLLLFVITPAVLWVLYNILQPALNQLNRMRSD